LSTIAAARQNEMKESITVVATTIRIRWLELGVDGWSIGFWILDFGFWIEGYLPQSKIQNRKSKIESLLPFDVLLCSKHRQDEDYTRARSL
jgi:hypothetical protein